MSASARVKSAPGPRASTSVARIVLPESGQGALGAPSVDNSVVDGYGCPRAVGADVPRQVVGQHRPKERCVDQPAPEFLRDDGHFDTGSPVGT